MEAAKVIAGYTLGGADMLRRAMGKKDPVAMAQERDKFVSGAKKLHNIDEKTSNAIFDILNKFAGYGFNKSHSARLRHPQLPDRLPEANYPVQFMAAMLSSELGNSEKVSHFVGECEAMGLKVLGPDVNESREMFTPVLRGGGAATVESSKLQVESQPLRPAGSPVFQLPTLNFQLRMAPPAPSASASPGSRAWGELAAQKDHRGTREKRRLRRLRGLRLPRRRPRRSTERVLEHLAKTGAFDFSGASRKKIFDGIDAAMAAVAATARDKAAGQHSFLDALADGAGGEPPRRARRAQPPRARRARTTSPPANATSSRRSYLGFYVSGHPMDTYAGLSDAIDTFPIGELLQQPDRTEFRLCGIVSNIAKKLSKKDNRPWAAFSLATKSASAALNMFADGYAAYGATLAENAAVLVQGNIIVGNDGARINVKECYQPRRAGRQPRAQGHLAPPSPRTASCRPYLRLLRETLNKQGGDTRVEFAFLFEGRVAPFAEASSRALLAAHRARVPAAPRPPRRRRRAARDETPRAQAGPPLGQTRLNAATRAPSAQSRL